jgi:hypothetical protein
MISLYQLFYNKIIIININEYNFYLYHFNPFVILQWQPMLLLQRPKLVFLERIGEQNYFFNKSNLIQPRIFFILIPRELKLN